MRFKHIFKSQIKDYSITKQQEVQLQNHWRIEQVVKCEQNRNS